MMKIIYRYSEADSPGKPKIASKMDCFRNFTRCFSGCDVTVLTDKSTSTSIEDEIANVTYGGNTYKVVREDCSTASKSHLLALELILSKEYAKFKNYDIVYILEDDYLHKEGAQTCIGEGLSIFDYVSCYDHPDKYLAQGPNPEIRNLRGAGFEDGPTFLTKSTHWKSTNSTTMTFAAKFGTIRADAFMMKEFCKKDYPEDYQMFVELRKTIGRTIGTTVPGMSTHTEKLWLSPLTDWDVV